VNLVFLRSVPSICPGRNCSCEIGVFFSKDIAVLVRQLCCFAFSALLVVLVLGVARCSSFVMLVRSKFSKGIYSCKLLSVFSIQFLPCQLLSTSVWITEDGLMLCANFTLIDMLDACDDGYSYVF
jgi:hypothetical protein